jgi:O-acetyl-ADP-ribose deacetylase (regulator of RNase III)
VLTYVQGSLFESPASVLVNAVNTMGVMGRGVAKQFRDIYPEMYSVYRRACERKELAVGGLLLHRTPYKSVLNFPTKRHWLYPSKVEYIEAGLQTLATCYEQYGLTNIAFPQLGCGTGGLDWESQVRPLMEQHLGALPINALVYIHDGGKTSRRSAEAVKARLSAEPVPVPFREVWALLLSWIERRSRDTLQNTDWWIERMSEDDQVIVCVRHGDDVHHIKQPMLFDVWKQLCAQGFLMPDDLPAQIASAAEPLFTVLSEQPWIDRAVLATKEHDLSTAKSQGIMFVAPTRSINQVAQVGLTWAAEDVSWLANTMPMRSNAS